MAKKPQIQYLNSDLDVASPVAIEALITAFKAKRVTPLLGQLNDIWYATFETDDDYREPDPNIARILDAIESLEDEALTRWKACTTREFNVGYDCGDEPWAFSQGLSNDTLRRMADCGTTFRVTIYPFRKSETQKSRRKV